MRHLFMVLALFVCLFNSGKVFAEFPDLPKELATVAQQNGCSPVKNFYDGLYDKEFTAKHPPPYPGVNRSFVFGYSAAGKKKYSAVFWCEVEDRFGNTSYQLVFSFKNPKLDTDGCPNIIRNRDKTSGLSIISGSPKSLDMFTYLEDVENEFRERSLFRPNDQDRIVESSVDGVGEQYYCFRGKWLMRSFFSDQ